MNDFKKYTHKDIIIIDCEASGLDKESYPIEVGVSFYDDSFSFLIKPDKEWVYWSNEAENIHHIKRKDLLENGISVYEAANILNSQLRGLTIFSDAEEYESFWINKLFKAAECEKLFEIESIYSLCLDNKKYKENKEIISKKYVLHRAENDANIIRQSLEKSLIR